MSGYWTEPGYEEASFNITDASRCGGIQEPPRITGFDRTNVASRAVAHVVTCDAIVNRAEGTAGCTGSVTSANARSVRHHAGAMGRIENAILCVEERKKGGEDENEGNGVHDLEIGIADVVGSVENTRCWY